MNPHPEKSSIDPLRRIFVPIEKRKLDGTLALSTTDGMRYVRTLDGVLRRVIKKVNGKKVKQARREARRA